MRTHNPAPDIATTLSLHRSGLLRLTLLLPFLLAGGCQFGANSEPTSTQEVAASPSPTVESLDTDSPLSKGASAGSSGSQASPEAENTDTPSEEEVSTEEPDTKTSSEEPAELTDIADLPTQEFVSTLNQLGVFEQTGSEFRPYDPITRGEYLTWMYKANNAIRRDTDHLRPAPTFDPGFTDIDESHPAYKYVQAFANAGYAVGYDDKTFKPDQQITREEMIALKIGLDTGEDHKPLKNRKGYLKFSDADQIDERYTGLIYQDRFRKNGARAFGSVKNLKPKQVVKRHEAAATLAVIHYSKADQALKRKIRESEKK